MSSPIEVMTLVEGKTEKSFIDSVLAPSLHHQGIYMSATTIGKGNGGDIRFSRAKIDIRNHLRQRPNTYVTLLIDFYGTKEWPKLEEARQQATHNRKSDIFNSATREEVSELFADCYPEKRFIPYVSMHEFEALLFSDENILAKLLNVDISEIHSIITECGSPENINNSQITAPSKRLKRLSNSFSKTSTGISIAKEIGIPRMREACPLFNTWIETIESLAI